MNLQVGLKLLSVGGEAARVDCKKILSVFKSRTVIQKYCKPCFPTGEMNTVVLFEKNTCLLIKHKTRINRMLVYQVASDRFKS